MRPKYLHTARLLLQRNQNPWQFITVLDTSDCNDLIWCRFGWQCLSSVGRAIQRQVEKPQWLQHLCYIFRVTRVHELLHAANVVPPTPRNRWQLHLPSSSTNLVGNCNRGRTGAGDRRHERDFTQMGQRPSGRYHGLQGSLHPGWWKHGVQGASEPGFPVRVFDAYSGL